MNEPTIILFSGITGFMVGVVVTLYFLWMIGALNQKWRII